MTTPILASFVKWEKEKPDYIFLRQPVRGEWREWSFRKAGDEIRKTAAGIQSMNLPARSNIAILSKNCAHWLIADLAIMMAGHVSVPLYANISDTSIKQILEHSQSQAIFIGKLDDYEKQREGIPSSVRKISIDFYGIAEGELLSKWIGEQEPLQEMAEWKADELMTIMYTSGTTGKPKGVMFNSSAFQHAVEIIMEYLARVKPLPAHPKLFSYLPLCHIAERHLTETLGCRTGAAISFVESLDSFARDLGSVQPHLFFGVPRIWSRFQEKILEKIPQKKLDLYLKIPLVSSLIKKELSRKLGVSHSLINVCGAAPMPTSLLIWLERLGIAVHEIYGMTENCALSHGNQEERRHGTVGRVMKSVDAKFSSEGEILTKHEAMMMGYFHEPTMTADVFTSDGFLKTGDMGVLDKDGFLTITGRVKDNFKTDKGKYVSPLPMELKLSKNSDIGQVCVVGMGIPQPIALIVLSEAGKLKSKEELKKSLTASIVEVSATVEDYEQLKKAVVMKDDWTIINGMMTPTLKIKRNEVEKVHLPKYPLWYAMEGHVVWE